MTVVKRDGRKVEFDKQKIRLAVLQAFNEVDKEETSYAKEKSRDIANYIEEYAKKADKDLSVEEIQDMVEDKLMASNRKDVARSYVIYRNDRQREREKYKSLMKQVGEKLRATNVANQNANVDEKSFGGRTGEAADVLTRQYALENLISPMARKNHENNEIYIHDLSSYAVGNHNCLTAPIDDLLAKGFNTRQVDIRPAQSVNTAFQLVAVIFQLQSLQQFGGVAASHLDWSMVPYVRKSFRKHYIDGLKYIENISNQELFDHIPDNAGIEDNEYMVYDKAYKYALDMTKKEVYQAVEAMYHNLNCWGD